MTEIQLNQRRTASETRDLVLEACNRILRHEGLTNLTLEAVAEEAGLSKGGLLYHFPEWRKSATTTITGLSPKNASLPYQYAHLD